MSVRRLGRDNMFRKWMSREVGWKDEETTGRMQMRQKGWVEMELDRERRGGMKSDIERKREEGRRGEGRRGEYLEGRECKVKRGKEIE